MPRGPKPKPTALKLLRGTERASRGNPAEPRPAPARPDPPEHLGTEARAEWQRVTGQLCAVGLLTGLDRAALAAYCQAYGRWVQAEDALATMAARDQHTAGLMIRTKAGNAIQNPLVGTANKAMADMMRYAAEFGMTPSARTRIHAEATRIDPDDPAAEFFWNPPIGDAANNRFVAPADGTYLFGATLLYKINASATARMRGRLELNGTTEIRGSYGEISVHTGSAGATAPTESRDGRRWHREYLGCKGMLTSVPKHRRGQIS